MISIVMPSRDQARFLPSALDSILGQSHTDLELIVVDGGSKDDSVEILREYAAKDSRLRWSSSPDSGPAQAVNHGMHQTRGDILAWLNADDLYAPEAIARAAHFFRDHPEAAMVYGHAEFIDQDGNSLGAYPTRGPSTPLSAFAEGCFICQPTVFLTRGAWSRIGGLDESLNTSFDFDLWIRMFAEFQGSIGFIDRVQARSRRHDATITSRHRRQVALEALGILGKHLALTPAHWILTHIEEIMAAHPDGSGQELHQKIASLTAEAGKLMQAEDLLEIEQRVATDRRIALAGRHSFVAVHPDGWAGPTLTARLDTRCLRGLKITGRSGLPPKCKHRLSIRAGKNMPSPLKVRGQQHFEAWLEAAGEAGSGNGVVQLTSDQVFRPCETEAGSTDGRALSVMVEAVEEVS